MYIVSFILGLIIVFSSIFLIRRELNRALLKQSQFIEHAKVYQQEDLFSMLETLQLSIDEMNRAFYDIANDMEGQMSIHQKEIEILQSEVQKLIPNIEKSKTKERIEGMKTPVPINNTEVPTQSEA